jgi:hypothetical protein
MSHDLLAELDTIGAFSSSPSDHLEHLFVPFQELVGEEVEDRLRTLALGARRVALIGPSGCGKSSLSSYVTRVRPFASIEIPVNSDPEVARQEKLFGQHLVRAIGRWGEAHGAIDPEDVRKAKAEASDREERPGGRSTTRFGGGADFVVIKADLGRELAEEGATINQPIPTEEVAQVARRMLQLVRHREITPVIVVDDSDRWLSDADRDTVDVFFGRILRWVAALDVAMIVAVHEGYQSAAGYRQARTEGWFEEELWLPALTESRQLGQILGKRIDQATGRRLEEVFEALAVEELFGYYIGDGRLSLRRTLTVSQEAARQAAKDPEATFVTPAAARAAIAGFV